MKYPIIFLAFLVANAKGECIKLPQATKDALEPIAAKCAPDLAMRSDESDIIEESTGVAGAGAALTKEMLGNFRTSRQGVPDVCPTLEQIAAATPPVLVCVGEELGFWNDNNDNGKIEVNGELIVEDLLELLGAETLWELLNPVLAEEANAEWVAAATKCGIQVPDNWTVPDAKAIETYVDKGCPGFQGFVGQIECFYNWIAAEVMKVCVE